jgi:predicted nucleic acid-binding protein
MGSGPIKSAPVAEASVAAQDARRRPRRRDDREYSFVDATSFALMRRLAMHEALAFDGDFAAAGFVELRA